ncbi:MAG: MoaD/ThiS family protein [Gemmataceae bacterium]
MRVEVLLFARARELAGAGSVAVEVPDGTVAGLRAALAAACPRLGELLPRCTVAVGGEFARDDEAIAPGAEVAVLPPVSGG